MITDKLMEKPWMFWRVWKAFSDNGFSVGGSTSGSTSYSTSIPFTLSYSLMDVHVVTDDITLTPDITNAVSGAVTLVRLVADGTSTITISGAAEVTGSSGYDNTADILNYLAFFYDGHKYFVNIYQEQNAQPVDYVVPVLQSAAISNSVRNRIVLTYDKTINPLYVPATSSFTASGGKTVSSVSISGMTVLVTVNTNYAYGDVVTIGYTPGAIKIQDSSNNLAAALSAQAVTNNIAAPDVVAPTISTKVVADANKNKIVLTYNEDLDGTSVPATTDFAVSGGKTVTNVAIVDAIVTLTVNSNYAYGDTITVSYTAGTNKIKDPSGNLAANLTASAVTNNIAAPSQILAWENLVGGATDSGGFLNYGGTLPSGGRGTISIDTTQPFEVFAQLNSLNPATVFFLDRDSANGYVWGAGQAFEAAVYHATSTLYWAVDDNVANSLGAVSLPIYVKLSKSGNDILLGTCATEFGSYTTVKTFTNALVGVPTLYIHVLFAANAAGDKIQVKYIV